MQKPLENAEKKQTCDGRTDRGTDGPTDKVIYRVACTRLKRLALLIARLINSGESFAVHYGMNMTEMTH